MFPKKCVAKCQICGKYFVGVTRSVKLHKCKSCGCHRKAVNLTHQVFDKLLVLHDYVKFDKTNSGTWDKVWWCFCRCSCGTYKEIRRATIISPTKHHSCGCNVKEINAKVQFKHGWAGTKFYDAYRHMCRRCSSKKGRAYKDYGSRGIRVCERWLNSFENFKEDMYESYLEHIKEHGELDTSLDRIDVNGNYSLENCRWATNKKQARNTTRNFYIDYHGMIVAFPDMCECFGLIYSRAYKYMHKHRGEYLDGILFDTYLEKEGIA